MRIFHYHPDTREFLDESEAKTSPRDGLPLIPQFATAEAPPEKGENQAAVFDPESGTWSLVPDYRGRTFYRPESGAVVLMDRLGKSPEEGFTEIPPPAGLKEPRFQDGEWVDAYEPDYKEQRKAAILEGWSVEDQLEALVEAQMGDTTKLNDLTAHVAEVKEKFPKKAESAKEKAL